MAQDPPPGLRRIGDHERDTAVAVLRRAAADGRLSLTELDGRLDAALAARTRADLEPVVADLGDASLPWTADRLPEPPRSAGYAPDDPLRLDGAERRLGVWTVPPFISINQESRWVRLDFQLARTDAAVIDIELIGGAGWVLLVLADGWAADVDRVSTGWGSKSIRVPREPAPGKPLIVLHGAIGAGRLRLRMPKPRDRRAARRRAKLARTYRRALTS